MALGEEALRDFRLQKLRKGRQSAIKQALKALEFADLVELGPHLDAMALICASQAERTQHGRPPEYYVRKRKKWERAMRREFSVPSRVWLGAFSQGRLVGYYYAYLISGTLFIAAAKSHTEALPLRPNDGMLFTLLERCRVNDLCRRVVFGDCSKNPSLDDFKESYGFGRLEIAVHRQERWLLRFGARLRAAVAGNSQ